MVEYLLTSMSPPNGELYPWMEIRSQTVKTNKLELVSDNSGFSSSVSGLPGTRSLFIRYRADAVPGESLLTMLPGNESWIYHPMLTSNDITGTSSSSNGLRIQPLTDTQLHMQHLAFKVIQPPTTMISYLTITIDFDVWKVNQDSLPAGSVLMFNIQLFQATLPDFSDEVALVGGSLQNDRFNIMLNEPDPTTNITATNKQVCRFTTTTSYTPPDQTTTFYRFKISRSTSTTDATKMRWDQITLTANLVDEST